MSVPAGTTVTLVSIVYQGSTLVSPGQVAFCDASASSCTDTHLIGLAQLNSSGQASINIVPGPGTHIYRAEFLGTNIYPKNTSAEATLVVTTAPAPTTSNVGAQASGSQGNYSLLGTVATNGGTSPTGAISFLDTTNANYSLGSAGLAPTGSSGSSFRTSFVVPAPNNTARASSPHVAVADFNGDGIPDIVVADPANSSIQILLGKGDGTFSASVIAPSGGVTYASEIVVGDFNQDGNADFAAATSETGITVWLGNGDGTFVQGQTISTTGGASNLMVGDFDRDGMPDIAYEYQAATSYVTYYYIQVLHGNGDGTFSTIAPPTQAPASALYLPVVADFNNDGKLDIAVIDLSGPVVVKIDILLGNGDGTFTQGTQLSQGPEYISMVAADFNGDGNEDLVVCNRDGKPATVFLGHGDGSFTALASGPDWIPMSLPPAVADFNGDGIPDLIFPNAAIGGASIFLGNGDGTFTADAFSPSEAGFTFASLAIADFNSDGLADIVEGLMDGRGITPPDNQVDVLLSQAPNTAASYVYNISPVGTGVHYVEASYPGDANNAAGISNLVPLLAVQVSTGLTLTATPSGGSSAGQQVTLTATLNKFLAQNHYASASVTFSNGSTNLGADTVVNGVATLTATALPVGTAKLKAYYPGDDNFTTSTSAILSYVVTNPVAQTITFPQPPTPAYAGTSVTLTATASSGLPMSYTVVSGPATANGSTLTYTGVGTVVVQADQSGNATYSAAAPVQVTVTVLPSTFTIALSPATLSLPPGQQGTATVQLVSIGAFAGPLTLTYGPLPKYATATLTPAAVTLTAGGGASATFSLKTTALAANSIPTRPGSRPRNLLAFAALLALLPLAFRKRRRLSKILTLILAAAALQTLAGCTEQYEFLPHVVSGTYQIPITATDANSNAKTAILTITVTP